MAEVGARGILTEAGEDSGQEYEVRSMSGTGRTIFAVGLTTGDKRKFVLRKDGQFRETGYRTGRNLALAETANAVAASTAEAMAE
jgi:hypothetical protein